MPAADLRSDETKEQDERVRRAVAAAYQRGHDIGRQTGWAEHQKYMTEMLLPHPVQ